MNMEQHQVVADPQDNVYDAVNLTDKGVVKVHPVHLMNMEQHQVLADPQTKPTDSGCDSWFCL